jgi:hypothetical protein
VLIYLCGLLLSCAGMPVATPVRYVCTGTPPFACTIFGVYLDLVLSLLIGLILLLGSDFF